MSKQEAFFRSLDNTPLTVEQKEIIIKAATDFALEEIKLSLNRIVLAQISPAETIAGNTTTLEFPTINRLNDLQTEMDNAA